MNEKFEYLNEISLKYVGKGLIDKTVNSGSGNGLSPLQCQAITWTDVDLLWIGPLGTDFNEI